MHNPNVWNNSGLFIYLEVIMKIEKMRCHPTIILEKAWGFLAAWIVIIFSQAENIISFFMEETLQKEDLPFILPLLGLLLLAPLLIAGLLSFFCLPPGKWYHHPLWILPKTRLYDSHRPYPWITDCTGSLTKTITLVPYSHIQHLCLRENPIFRRFDLFHGEIYILASMANRTIPFPYITESEKSCWQKNGLLGTPGDQELSGKGYFPRTSQSTLWLARTNTVPKPKGLSRKTKKANQLPAFKIFSIITWE